jgi:hypothetical protein|tara:strand:+ start:345 stop:569 length:225 start_codon:yes stop_codon:yes gene_type:complete
MKKINKNMTKNNLKKNFKNFEKAVDKMFIDILKDISIRHNISIEDLKKYYPNNFFDHYEQIVMQKQSTEKIEEI